MDDAEAGAAGHVRPRSPRTAHDGEPLPQRRRREVPQGSNEVAMAEQEETGRIRTGTAEQCTDDEQLCAWRRHMAEASTELTWPRDSARIEDFGCIAVNVGEVVEKITHMNEAEVRREIDFMLTWFGGRDLLPAQLSMGQVLCVGARSFPALQVCSRFHVNAIENFYTKRYFNLVERMLAVNRDARDDSDLCRDIDLIISRIKLIARVWRAATHAKGTFRPRYHFRLCPVERMQFFSLGIDHLGMNSLQRATYEAQEALFALGYYHRGAELYKPKVVGGDHFVNFFESVGQTIEQFVRYVVDTAKTSDRWLLFTADATVPRKVAAAIGGADSAACPELSVGRILSFRNSVLNLRTMKFVPHERYRGEDAACCYSDVELRVSTADVDMAALPFRGAVRSAAVLPRSERLAWTESELTAAWDDTKEFQEQQRIRGSVSSDGDGDDDSGDDDSGGGGGGGNEGDDGDGGWWGNDDGRADDEVRNEHEPHTNWMEGLPTPGIDRVLAPHFSRSVRRFLWPLFGRAFLGNDGGGADLAKPVLFLGAGRAARATLRALLKAPFLADLVATELPAKVDKWLVVAESVRWDVTKLDKALQGSAPGVPIFLFGDELVCKHRAERRALAERVTVLRMDRPAEREHSRLHEHVFTVELPMFAVKAAAAYHAYRRLRTPQAWPRYFQEQRDLLTDRDANYDLYVALRDSTVFVCEPGAYVPLRVARWAFKWWCEGERDKQCAWEEAAAVLPLHLLGIKHATDKRGFRDPVCNRQYPRPGTAADAGTPYTEPGAYLEGVDVTAAVWAKFVADPKNRNTQLIPAAAAPPGPAAAADSKSDADAVTERVLAAGRAGVDGVDDSSVRDMAGELSLVDAVCLLKKTVDFDAAKEQPRRLQFVSDQVSATEAVRHALLCSKVVLELLRRKHKNRFVPRDDLNIKEAATWLVRRLVDG